MTEPRPPRRPVRRRRSSLVDLPWNRRAAAPPLVGQAWTPGEAASGPDRGRPALRASALAAAALELALLAWLLAGPSFHVRHVEVTGNHNLKTADVVAAAGLARPGSVFAVDTATIRRKLTATPWVREAKVATVLPDRVVLNVDEWQPVAVYMAGANGRPMFLSDQGAVLGPAPSAQAALEVDGPAGADPRVGARPVEPRLLTALVNIQRGLPGLVGQQVKSFSVDACGNVSMTVQRGWRADFGRVITPEEYAALDQKLAALKSVAVRENLNSADVEYVNLENAQLPAVGLKAKPSPAPAALPSPSPSGAALAPRPVGPVATCR